MKKSLYKSERRVFTVAKSFIVDKALLQLLTKTKRRYDQWFQVELHLPHVTILTNRRQIYEYWGTPQPSWLVGWYHNNGIYVINQKVSQRSKEQWNKLVVHEIAHIYINHVSHQHVPRWVNEGLACYLAKQKKRMCTTEDILKYFKKQPRRSPDIYRIGHSLIDKLIGKYGQRKLLRFLQGLQTTELKYWQNVFYRVYKIKWATFLLQLYEKA